MSVWEAACSQAAVVETLQRAVRASRGNSDMASAAMSQAWLITGPPGSGRSIVARAFAAALECTEEEPGCGRCHGCTTTLAGTHPDVELYDTAAVTISVEDTRALVAKSYVFPTVGRKRVIAIEDADRMLERTTNVLLKAMEEPPPDTVWILITSSPQDVLPTIRSRCRIVTLKVPDAGDVASIIHADHSEMSTDEALNIALMAQCHIGRARGLARDIVARDERKALLSAVLRLNTVGDCVFAAKDIVDHFPAVRKKYVEKGGETVQEELRRNELERFRTSIGLRDGDKESASQRAQIRQFTDAQKKQETRQHRDYIDRVLLDILSLYRDILTLQLGSDVGVMNRDFEAHCESVASQLTLGETLERMDAIAHARERIGRNMPPQLALEALFVNLRLQKR